MTEKELAEVKEVVESSVLYSLGLLNPGQSPSMHERLMSASLAACVGERAANLFRNAAPGEWGKVSEACAARILALIGEPSDEQD